MRAVFEHSTVAALADALERARRAAPERRVPAVLAVPRPAGGSGLPLSFSQERLWLLDRLTPGAPVYNLPLALRLDGGLAVVALRTAFEAVLRRHEVLRTRLVVRDSACRRSSNWRGRWAATSPSHRGAAAARPSR